MLKRPKGVPVLVCTCSNPGWPILVHQMPVTTGRTSHAGTGFRWTVLGIRLDWATFALTGQCPVCRAPVRVAVDRSHVEQEVPDYKERAASRAGQSGLGLKDFADLVYVCAHRRAPALGREVPSKLVLGPDSLILSRTIKSTAADGTGSYYRSYYRPHMARDVPSPSGPQALWVDTHPKREFVHLCRLLVEGALVSPDQLPDWKPSDDHPTFAEHHRRVTDIVNGLSAERVEFREKEAQVTRWMLQYPDQDELADALDDAEYRVADPEDLLAVLADALRGIEGAGEILDTVGWLLARKARPTAT